MRKLAVLLLVMTGVFGSLVSEAAAVQCDYDVLVLVEGKSRGYAVFPNTSSECAFVSAALSTVLNSSKAYLTAVNLSFVCAKINMDKPFYSVVTAGHCAPPVSTKSVDAADVVTKTEPVELAPIR